jgi:hypothetical protein
MIEIEDGFYIDPWKVAAVKKADKGKCVLYLDGQSALEGFVLARKALEVAEEIVDARNGEEDGGEDDNG